ncbi:hypothetical protein [Robbsia sp. KACC 23696]|uniref:SMP-30/gluconolactonase/LRE family protein n=1 Tax=Robbsia sp. KACC 23696 TaxID=3149231 RepID=UPI00325BA320
MTKHVRREFLKMAGFAGLSIAAGSAVASSGPLPLKVAARSPWMANQVALTRNNTLFLGLPRYARDTATPSLARRDRDGALSAFPGNAWNDWKPGDDGRMAFVYLNSVHIFADDSVWCVDQGSLSPGVFPGINETLAFDAQKLIQLDPISGNVLTVLRFDESILPPGAQMNDLRFHGTTMYISDSGLGGIIVHDRKTGTTRRRLSGQTVTKASLTHVPEILAHIKGNAVFHPPNSDLLEITADGQWLYWAAPTGPFYRIRTRFLNDARLSDADLAAHVERVYENAFSGGCAMDSLGNVYFCETVTHHITVLSPTGRTAIIASDPALIRPDGAFIGADRRLYIPVKRPLPPSGRDAADAVANPFAIYAIDLPKHFDGIALGDAVTGR